jgi:flagellar hook-associated protein 1 FlgK
MADFSGLRLALTALQAQRRGLELAAQNAANVNTEGYSRQRVDLETIGAPATPALWSVYRGDGGGVRVAQVTRFRDQFLEIRASLEHASNADLDRGRVAMERIQQLFDEPSDTGIRQQLSDLWAGFDDVANHPGDVAARMQLLERANTVAETMNGAATKLTQQRVDTLSELVATVDEINSVSEQIASLNQAIKANTISGLPVNDLKDKRDLLVTKLAELSGATVRESEFGQLHVVLNGTALVQNDRAQAIQVDTSGPTAVVRWVNNSAIASVTTGKAGGQLRAANITIPGYLARLDAVATTLRGQVNNVHGAISGTIAAADSDQTAAGNLQFEIALDGGAYATATVVGADWSGPVGAAALQTALQNSVNTAIGAGNATVTVTGGSGSPLAVSIAPTATHELLVRASGTNTGFATLLGTTPVGTDGVGGRMFFSGTSAATLAVSDDIAGNPAAVAAGIATNGPLDGSIALALATQAESTSGADEDFRQMIVQLGVDTSTAISRSNIQDKATESLDRARSAQSAVNLDEEMTSMVEYQHAYEAAARFLTVIDEMLDTLINRTGA